MPEPQPPAEQRGSGRRQRVARRRGANAVHETSAGGVVVDRTDAASAAVLIGRTNGSGTLDWVLPKGHIEPGETATDAAVREVQEETGIRARIVGLLGTLDYSFTNNAVRIHKTVHHYVLEAVDGELHTEDIEVSAVAWVPLSELPTRLRHQSERELLDRLTDLVTVAVDGGTT